MIILLLATRKIISTWIVHPLWGSCSMDLVINSDRVCCQRLCSVPCLKILAKDLIKDVTIVVIIDSKSDCVLLGKPHSK